MEPPGLGGVLPKAKGGPDVLEGSPTSVWVPSDRYYQSSFSLIVWGRNESSARIRARVTHNLARDLHQP